MAAVKEPMRFTERLVLLFALAVSCSFSLGLLFSEHIQAEANTVSAFRLEIVNSSGRPRIAMMTDSQGTAKITFIDPDHKAESVLEQFRDGAINLSFAGKGGAAGYKPNEVSPQTDEVYFRRA